MGIPEKRGSLLLNVGKGFSKDLFPAYSLNYTSGTSFVQANGQGKSQLLFWGLGVETCLSDHYHPNFLFIKQQLLIPYLGSIKKKYFSPLILVQIKL